VAGGEDRLVEARVAGVQDRVGAHLADQRDERRRIGCVDLRGREAIRLAEPLDGGPCALGRDIRDRHLLEERATLRDRRHRRPDSPRTDDEDPHVPTLPAAGGGVARPRRQQVACLQPG
jgi:hypothetical protein